MFDFKVTYDAYGHRDVELKVDEDTAYDICFINDPKINYCRVVALATNYFENGPHYNRQTECGMRKDDVAHTKPRTYKKLAQEIAA